MRIRKALAAVAIGSLLASGAAACDLVTPRDYHNREDDCGFTDADRKRKPVHKPPKGK